MNGRNGFIPIFNSTRVLHLTLFLIKVSVLRQKGQSQNGSSKKTNHAKFSKNRTSFTPWYAHVVCVSGGKKCLFLRKFGVLCFLFTSVLVFTFLLYYRQNSLFIQDNFWIFQLGFFGE